MHSWPAVYITVDTLGILTDRGPPVLTSPIQEAQAEARGGGGVFSVLPSQLSCSISSVYPQRSNSLQGLGLERLAFVFLSGLIMVALHLNQEGVALPHLQKLVFLSNLGCQLDIPGKKGHN